MTYPTEAIYEEVAYLAYHLGWARDDLLDLEHAERRRYVGLVDRIDARARG